jgi:hypothetical protein
MGGRPNRSRGRSKKRNVLSRHREKDRLEVGGGSETRTTPLELSLILKKEDERE